MTFGSVPLGEGTLGEGGGSSAPPEAFSAAGVSFASSWGTATGLKKSVSAIGASPATGYTGGTKTTKRSGQAQSSSFTYGGAVSFPHDQGIAALVGLSYLAASGAKKALGNSVLSDLGYASSEYAIVIPGVSFGSADLMGFGYLTASGQKTGQGEASIVSFDLSSGTINTIRSGSGSSEQGGWPRAFNLTRRSGDAISDSISETDASSFKKISFGGSIFDLGWLDGIGEVKPLHFGALQSLGYASAIGSKRLTGAGAVIGAGFSSASGKKALRAAIEAEALTFLTANGIKTANGAAIFWTINTNSGRVAVGKPVPVTIEIFVLGERITTHVLEVDLAVTTLGERISFQSVDAITRKV